MAARHSFELGWRTIVEYVGALGRSGKRRLWGHVALVVDAISLFCRLILRIAGLYITSRRLHGALVSLIWDNQE